MSTFKYYISGVILFVIVVAVIVGALSHTVLAQPSYTINYQGKLTTSAGVAVADGTYNMRFWLINSPSNATTTAQWTETRTGGDKVTVENGLFSVMLGSVTPLTSVDFNQTLYLAVEIGGSASVVWDGEMSPRKLIGTVPSAFEAKQLGGVASSSFLRSDAADSASSLITFNGGLFSNSSSTLAQFNFVSATGTRLYIGGDSITEFAGTNLVVTGGALGLSASYLGQTSITTLGTITSGTWNGTAIGTSYLDSAVLLASELDTSAKLAALLTDETGTGRSVFSISPAFSGTPTFAALTATSTLTLSGTAANIALGSNYLSGDGDDEGIYVGSTGNVGIGTTSPYAKLSVAGDLALTGGLYDSGASKGTNGMVLLSTGTGVDWVATSSLNITGGSGLVSGDIDTSSELLAILTDETGTGNLVFSNSPVFTTPNLGTPSTLTLTNATGLPISTGVSGLAANVATFLATPSSSNFYNALTDRTGTAGTVVFSAGPTFTGSVNVSSVQFSSGNITQVSNVRGGTVASAKLTLAGTTHSTPTSGGYISLEPNNGVESFRFTANNRFGIGTTTPNQKIGIFASGADAAIEFSTITGGAEKWTLGIDDSDGAKFKISSSSALGTDDRLTINGSGGITFNSDYATNYSSFFFNDGNDQNRYGLKVQAGADDASGTTYYLDAYDGDGGQVGYIANTSGTFALTDVSDRRTKVNITDTEIVNATDIIGALTVVDFNRRQDPDGPRITGFIAQDVQAVFPFAVTENPKTGYLGVMKDAFVPLLVKGAQEQQGVIAEQGMTIAKLGDTLLQNIKTVSDLQAMVASSQSEDYRTQDTSLEPGEIVALELTADTAVIRALPGSLVFGVVVEAVPSATVSAEDIETKQIALSGRTRVKVNKEGGDIEVGDAITLSSEPGVGTKATTTGRVIGTALQEFNDDEGSILVFVEPKTHFAYQEDIALTSLFTSIENDPQDTLWNRLVTIATNFVDGVLTVAGVKTDELCVGEVCVDEATFLQIVENADTSYSPPTPPPEESPDGGGDSSQEDKPDLEAEVSEPPAEDLVIIPEDEAQPSLETPPE